MARYHLGLFYTPADRRHVRLSLAVFALVLAAVAVIAPFRNVPLGHVRPFVPIADSIQFIDEVIISALLFSQGTVLRSRALTALAASYLFTALVLIPHMLTFPGAFTEAGLLGAKVNTTVWLASVRRFAFPGAVILYVLLKDAGGRREEAGRPPPTIRQYRWALAAAVLAGLVTVWTTLGHDFLPPLFVDASRAILPNMTFQSSATAVITVVAMVLLLKRPRKSVLELWLLVALAVWICQFLPLEARFTVGWYALFGMLAVSNLIVIVALIAESNRLFVKLALAVGAQDREREAKVMSMDAVAAAIGHEVGQALTGIGLTATGGMRHLQARPPNLEAAMASTRSTLDGVRDAFEAIKSVRAMYSAGPSRRTAFSLNALVLETKAAMELEIEAHRIAVEIDLAADLAAVEANRVQIKRVVLNLITNAVESLVESGRGERRLVIRTAPAGEDQVLLEVGDNGVGIAPERLETIFEPFVTSKATGTGLGLSLCRIIVEEHGGRLWATSAPTGGAAFHMQLPSGRAEATG